MRLLLLALFVLISVCSGAFAQLPAPPGPSSASAQTPKSESVIEQKHIRARFEKDGTSERVLKLRAKVLTEQAVREWGQLPLNYMPEVEGLTVMRVRVEKADGSVIADATGSVQDVAVRPPTAMPIFLDLRQKVIAVARDGDDALRSLEKSLRAIKPDVEFPPEAPTRLALTLYVACSDAQGCAATSVFPPDVRPRR